MGWIVKVILIVSLIGIEWKETVGFFSSNNVNQDWKIEYGYLAEKCPKVKALRNFDINSMMGFWYVVQYYASSEEVPEYGCMRSMFTMSLEDKHVTMNFTYIYADDPIREPIQGNITWQIPDFRVSAHWLHKEHIFKDIYNTYIIDTDYKSWALVMHCAEKAKSPRYLSALLLSRKIDLGINVINFLREKLPRYGIDIAYMFPIEQNECNSTDNSLFSVTELMRPNGNNNPIVQTVNDNGVSDGVMSNKSVRLIKKKISRKMNSIN